MPTFAARHVEMSTNSNDITVGTIQDAFQKVHGVREFGSCGNG